MAQVAVDHDLAVDPRERAGQASRAEHQRGFEQQDPPQAPRAWRPSRRRPASHSRRCRRLDASAAAIAAIAASSSSVEISRSWPSPSLVSASMLASARGGGRHFQAARTCGPECARDRAARAARRLRPGAS